MPLAAKPTILLALDRFTKKTCLCGGCGYVSMGQGLLLLFYNSARPVDLQSHSFCISVSHFLQGAWDCRYTMPWALGVEPSIQFVWQVVLPTELSPWVLIRVYNILLGFFFFILFYLEAVLNNWA